MEWMLPLLIFFARICDVSVGTFRIICVMRGQKMLAVVLGFFEVMLWLFAVSAVITSLDDNLWMAIAYGAGFAGGTLLGMTIEERLAIGHQIVRVVIPRGEHALAPFLRHLDLTVTEVPARSAQGEAELCFFALPRREVRRVTGIVLEQFPDAFVTVEDIREQPRPPGVPRPYRSRQPGWRKVIKFK